jgi:hypothetical protein
VASAEPAEPDASPSPAEDAGTGRLLLELAGAAAGALTFVYLAGGLVVRARLNALELPADATLPLLPRETSLFAGVRLLLPSLVLGALVLFGLSIAGSRPSLQKARTDAVSYALLGATGLVIVGLAAYVLAEPISDGKRVVVVLSCAAALGLAALLLRGTGSFRGAVAGLFAVIALLTGVLGILRASAPPIELDFAVLHMKDGGRTSGYLLAQSSDAVLLAPDVEGHTIGRVASIPRSDVVDLRVARGPDDGIRPLRRDDEVYRRVGMHDTLPAPPGREQTLRSRLFMAQVRGSTLWKYPPIVLPASIRQWRRRYAEFAAAGVQPWSEEGVRVSLEELNEEPNLFEGRVVITRGRLAAISRHASRDPAVARRFVVVESDDKRRFRAVCPVASPADRELRPGGEVTIRGFPLAVGTFVSGSGSERRRVAMVCSALRQVSP